MMTPKTIVIFDHDTQNTSRFIQLFDDYFDLHTTRFNSLPEVRKSQISAFFLLCMRPDNTVFNKIGELNFLFNKTPVVLFSPQPQPEDVTQAVACGAKAYFKIDSDETPVLNWLACFYQKKESESFLQKCKNYLFPLKSTFSTPFYTPEPIKNEIVPTEKIGEILEKIRASSQKEPEMVSEKKDSNTIQAYFFGNFVVRINDKEVNVRNGALLLAYLLLNNKPIHKQRLMDRFWGDSDSDSARNCLNSTIHALRKAFSEVVAKPPVIVFNNEHYSIHSHWKVETDVERFKQNWQKSLEVGRKQGFQTALPLYKELIELYEDDFLVNFPNVEWALGERDTFRERYMNVLQHVADHYLNAREFGAAIEYYKNILEKEESLEEIHRKLMTCFYELKMKDRALRQYKKCVEVLEKSKRKPSRETKELHEKMLDYA